MKKAITVFLALFAAFSAPLLAEEISAAVPAGAVTLQGLVDEALKKSPSVQSKKAGYEALRAKVVKAWLPEDPMAGLDVEGQSDFFNDGSRMNREYMLQQTIPFPTKLFLSGVIASREADVAYHAYKEEERAVAVKVEHPSHQLFLARRTIFALEETRSLIERLSGAVRARYEANQTGQTDYLKVQIELEQVSIELFDWRQKAHVAEAAISRQLNRPLDTSYAMEEQPKHAGFSLTLADLEKMALAKRPELKSFEAGVARAKASSALSRTEWLPDITGRLEARKFRGEDDVREYDNFIGFSVPVWSLLKGMGGGWAGARKEVEAAEALYTDMKNEVLFRIHEAHAAFRSAENALNTYESLILPQARSQADIALSAYEAGKADVLDLIDAQRTFKNTQIGYYKAMADYEMAFSDLRLAVGDDLKGIGGKIS